MTKSNISHKGCLFPEFWRGSLTCLRNVIKVSTYICYERGCLRFYHQSDRFYFMRAHPRMKPPCPAGGKFRLRVENSVKYSPMKRWTIASQLCFALVARAILQFFTKNITHNLISCVLTQDGIQTYQEGYLCS